MSPAPTHPHDAPPEPALRDWRQRRAQNTGQAGSRTHPPTHLPPRWAAPRAPWASAPARPPHTPCQTAPAPRARARSAGRAHRPDTLCARHLLRNAAPPPPVMPGPHLHGQLGGGVPGADGVQADAVPRPLHRQVARQLVHGCLGHGVQRPGAHADGAACRAAGKGGSGARRGALGAAANFCSRPRGAHSC